MNTAMSLNRADEAEFDRVLKRELDQRTPQTAPPSAHVQAHRDYERQKFHWLGRNPQPRNMAYNLYEDCTRTLRWAYRTLVDSDYRKMTGFTQRTIPRRAVCRIAEAIGYRLMRGTESIEHKLKGDDLTAFRSERMKYCHHFEQTADNAHACNEKGQHPDLALDVVLGFRDELLALCPWFERIGMPADAERLRKSCADAMRLPDYVELPAFSRGRT